MNKIIIEVSIGELLDKISILEIKQEKIKDPEKLRFISNEHSILKDQLDNNVKSDDKLNKLFQSLKKINAKLWIIEDDKLLLHRIPESAGQLAGQYELPELRAVKARTSTQLITSKSRSITHRRIKEYIYQTIVVSIDDSLEWVALDELEAITLSGPHRRWILELLKDR